MSILKELLSLNEQTTWIASYARDGEKFTLWQEAHYNYRLTKAKQNANGKFENELYFANSSLATVEHTLRKEGYVQLKQMAYN